MSKSPVRKPKPTAGPSTLAMVIEAVKTIDDKKGASVTAIKSFIIGKYDADPVRLKSLLKKALEKGLQTGVLKRPKNQETQTAGLSGRYKLDKEGIAKMEKSKLKPKKVAEKKATHSATTKVKKPSVKSDKSPQKSPKKKKMKTSTERSGPTKTPSAKKKRANLNDTRSVGKTPKKSNKAGANPRSKKDIKVKQPKTQTKTPKKKAGK